MGFPFIYLYLLFNLQLFLIEVQLIYNVLLLLCVQKSDSYTHTHTHTHTHTRVCENSVCLGLPSQPVGLSLPVIPLDDSYSILEVSAQNALQARLGLPLRCFFCLIVMAMALRAASILFPKLPMGKLSPCQEFKICEGKNQICLPLSLVSRVG